MNRSHPLRLIALVGVLEGERRVVHTQGFPLDPEQMLPTPDVVLVTSNGDGAMLFRYTAHGELAGDTPHDTTDDACAQAAEEYGEALSPWMRVPDDIPDAHVFAVRYAADQLNDRPW